MFVGTFTRTDSLAGAVHRAVLADVQSRYLLPFERATVGALFARETGEEESRAGLVEELGRAGIWFGGGTLAGVDRLDAPALQRCLDRLAETDAIVVREQPTRTCVRCRSSRTPEAIIYQEESGEAFLVRFPLAGSTPRTSLVVWTDAAWKLLGTSVILLNPELPYVVVRYQRKDVDEQILVAKAALDRLRQWMPGSEFTVVEERPGSEWAGAAYEHPLSSEYPPIAWLPRPGGTLVASSEVGESGTGLVTLVPGHGASDAVIARGLHLHGLPVVAMDGRVERSTIHKYAGLSIDGAEAFILRDLADSGWLFAQLKVRRGVPRCAVCGTALIFVPRRAWALEPGRLPPALLQLFQRLLPDEPVPQPPEPVPWPVSDVTEGDGDSPKLLECEACDRLAPATATGRCTCGGARSPIRRRLVVAFHEAMAAWAPHLGLTGGDPVRLILPERRRTPAVVHFLSGAHATGAQLSEVHLTLSPSIRGSKEGETPWASTVSHDAVRAALVRLGDRGVRGHPLTDRIQQETRRLQKLWSVAHVLTTAMARDGFSPEFDPLAGHAEELLEEDRAFLSGFERLRLEVRRAYENGDATLAHTLLTDFAELELRNGYYPLVEGRLHGDGLSPPKVGAYRVLGHVLTTFAELYAPIAPFTMETVQRALRGDGRSIFERGATPIQERLLDADAERQYAHWISITGAIRHGRAEIGVRLSRQLPTVVLFVRDEAVALQLRQGEAVVRRLIGAEKLEVASPNYPWEGRSIEAAPVETEIQKVYPTLVPRIVRLLRELPGRRVRDGLRTQSLSFILGGHSVQILPSMVEVIETLPEGFVPVPWPYGEIFLQLPPELASAGSRRTPSLSLDGFHLLRAVRRQLRRAASAANEVVFALPPGLADEVDRQGPVIARYLGVGRVRLLLPEEKWPEGSDAFGRTGKGERWRFVLPGVAGRRRTRKARIPQAAVRRIALPSDDRSLEEDEPLLQDAEVERQRSVREIVERLDAELGRPLVGPGKIRNAWDAGLRTYEDFTHVPWTTLAEIPGFGPRVALEVVQRVGVNPPTSEAAAEQLRALEAVRASAALELRLPAEPPPSIFEAPSPSGSSPVPPPSFETARPAPLPPPVDVPRPLPTPPSPVLMRDLAPPAAPGSTISPPRFVTVPARPV
ncbi:MAG: class I tRNA ligase family protein, partial [Thermoplasmata archaeon]|nr:class I tRNA ligase family protein [Thermoplasmata archaeon]